MQVVTVFNIISWLSKGLTFAVSNNKQLLEFLSILQVGYWKSNPSCTSRNLRATNCMLGISLQAFMIKTHSNSTFLSVNGLVLYTGQPAYHSWDAQTGSGFSFPFSSSSFSLSSLSSLKSLHAIAVRYPVICSSSKALRVS